MPTITTMSPLGTSMPSSKRGLGWSTGALFVILMAAAGYWGSESHNRAAEAATDHRSPIPLRNDENNVCACSERPPRVPAGRSACGTVGSLEATAGN